MVKTTMQVRKKCTKITHISIENTGFKISFNSINAKIEVINRHIDQDVKKLIITLTVK